MDQTVVQAIIATALIPLAGIFAALESALITVSVARVTEMSKQPRAGSARLLGMLGHRASYINFTVLLHTLCLVAAAVLFTDFFIEVLDSTVWGAAAAIGVAAVAGFVLAGVLPRTLGRLHAYSIACAGAWPLSVLGLLLRPITRLLVWIGNLGTPGRGFTNGPFANEIELREMVDMATEGGVVDAEEQRMIQSVFDLGDTSAREIMTPRTEMVWIESAKTVLQASRLAVRSGHTRIPVIGDNVDDIVGVAYLRDLVARLNAGRGDELVSETMRQSVFVPDSKEIDALLREMQRDRIHIAFAVDEWGGIAGIVTIEDILEEIVGEIVDEHDSREVAPVEDLGGGRYRLSARLDLGEVAELFDIEFPEEVTGEVDTVSGLLALELGRMPLAGARAETSGISLVAEGGRDKRGRLRVVTVVAEKLPEPTVSDAPAGAESREREEAQRT